MKKIFSVFLMLLLSFGVPGWAKAKVINKSADNYKVIYRGTVASFQLNTRTGPSLGSDVLVVANRGDKIDVIEERGGIGGWLTVIINGRKGFIRNRPKYITLEKALTPPPPNKQAEKKQPAIPQTGKKADRTNQKGKIKSEIEAHKQKAVTFSHKEVVDDVSAVRPSLLDRESSSLSNSLNIQLSMAGGSVSGSVSDTSSKLSYTKDNLLFNFELGLGYYAPDWGNNGIQARIGLGTTWGENLAIGGLYSYNRHTQDAVVNTIWQTPVESLRLKGSVGYLWGEKDFDFLSGTATQDLNQMSGLIGAEFFKPKKASDLGFQKLGLNVWWAKADEETDDGSTYYMVETTDSYTYYLDPRELSEGELTGVGFDVQYAICESMVVKGALGVEKLKFPYADGTEDDSTDYYSNLTLFWQPVNDVIVESAWQHGASGDLYRFNVTKGSYKLGYWYNQGDKNLDDEHAVMLSYTFRFGPSRSKAKLASQMRPSGQPNLLRETLVRPDQLPRTFLAKVDDTAVETVAVVDKSGLSSAATVDSSGNIHVTVGSGTPTITGVTRNGIAFIYTGIIEATTTDIVIHTNNLPEGVATYFISVSAGGAYTIKIETE